MARVTVMFNGHVMEGELLRETDKRMLVRFTTRATELVTRRDWKNDGAATTTLGWTREKWFTKVAKPEGRLVGRRTTLRDGDVTIPANSGFVVEEATTT